MLTEIKRLIAKQKRISLYDLSIHFGVEESAMEKMLETWLQKGKLKRTDFSYCQSACTGCVKFNCFPSKMIFYEWVAE